MKKNCKFWKIAFFPFWFLQEELNIIGFKLNCAGESQNMLVKQTKF